ncbi:S-(hydroxymethyl)mycothiol dehydrogenase, partial [Rhodococcus sp. 1R11]
EMPLIDFFSRGGSLKSSWYGDCLPERDFPMLVDLYEQGRLPLEKFVTERIGLDDIEAAFTAMHEGKVLRSVVVL